MKNVFNLFVLILLIFSSVELFSQTDPIKYSSDFKFCEGIYKNYAEFKINDPSIRQKALVYENSGTQFIVGNFAKMEKVCYYDSSGNYHRIDRKDVWGFCSKGTIYIKLKDNYHRLVKIGAIIYFIESHSTLYYNNSMPLSKINRPNRDIQFMIDFYTGNILNYNLKNFTALLKRDTELYNEFISIKRKSKKEEQMFIYLNRFNERNPIFFNLN